jgi:hypothetical protein
MTFWHVERHTAWWVYLMLDAKGFNYKPLIQALKC